MVLLLDLYPRFPRALARIGVTDRIYHYFERPRNADDVLQEEAQAELRQLSTHVAALFVATSLNLNRLNLLLELERTRLAWQDIQKRLKQMARIKAALSEGFPQVLQTIQEAMRLQQWLLVDEWLSRTGRVRTQDINMIAMRRLKMGDLVLALSAKLVEAAKERGAGSSSNSKRTTATPMICDQHKWLAAHLHELLQQFHAAFGAGAAMNNR
jgi:hypothetical protein